ncbi:MAG: type II secretion system protein GspJ, partial [Verrucomicrobiota bacterium]
MNQSRTHQGAFTLLELLIAVSIFAIVLAAINTVFYSALRLRNKTVAALEEALPLQHALLMMKRDLSNLVPPAGILSGTLQTTLKMGVDGQVSPDFFTATGTLDELVPWGDVQKISYLLRAPANGGAGKELIRATTRNLLAIIQDPPEEQSLLFGVENLTFSYYDGSQWQSSWDSTTQTNFPT